MKLSSCLLALASSALAFPSRMFELSMSEEEKRAITGLAAAIEASAKNEKRAGLPTAPGFNAAQQYISNTGQYAYVPPGPNDLRGPCPGLNAMANHGLENPIQAAPQVLI